MYHLSNKGLGGFVNLNYPILGRKSEEASSTNSGAHRGGYRPLRWSRLAVQGGPQQVRTMWSMQHVGWTLAG